MNLLRVTAPVAIALALGGCSLGGLLGGGKAPPWLLTLTPEAPAPASLDGSGRPSASPASTGSVAASERWRPATISRKACADREGPGSDIRVSPTRLGTRSLSSIASRSDPGSHSCVSESSTSDTPFS